MYSEVIGCLNQEREVSFTPVSDSAFEGLVFIHDEQIKLRIDLGKGFPETFPEISIPDDSHFRAHVPKGRNICLFDQESIMIKPDMAEQVLIDAFDRAVTVLEMDAQTQKEEVLREFISYWGADAKQSVRLYMNLPEAMEHEYKEYTAIGQSAYCLLVSNSTEESKELLVNNVGCDPNRVNDHKMPCIRIRLRATTLPPMTEGITWKSIRRFILDNITAGQKRYFKKMLSVKAKVINRLLLLAIPSSYGDQYACIWLHHDNSKGECLKNITNCYVEQVTSFRIDAKYLLTRGGAETGLLDKRVLLIGCGSVGGFLAESLCQCGIGTLDILDKDRISIENVHRHVLGFNDATTGGFKADLLKKRLDERFPYVEIDSLSFEDRTAEALLKDVERMSDYDLIVSATGNPTVDLAINDAICNGSDYPAFVACFNEPYGIGGHAIGVLKEGGCLRCLYSDPISGELSSFQGSFVEAGQSFSKSLSGCAGTYVEYSVLDSQQTATMASRLIIDILNGKCMQSKIVSWIGSPEKLRNAGFITSEYYSDFEQNGATMINRYFSRMERCRSCGK